MNQPAPDRGLAGSLRWCEHPVPLARPDVPGGAQDCSFLRVYLQTSHRPAGTEPLHFLTIQIKKPPDRLETIRGLVHHDCTGKLTQPRL